jgi:hypothetical protein
MRSKGLIAAAATAVVLSLATGAAKADTVQFTVVDGATTVTFDVAESPGPSLHTSTLFQLDDIPINITSNGYKTGATENLDFYAATGNTEFIADSGSWYADTLGNILATGAYFTGSTADPTFVPGTYGSAGDSVAITDLSATPLPSAWTMMLSALLGLGFIVYRGGSRRSAAVAA